MTKQNKILIGVGLLLVVIGVVVYFVMKPAAPTTDTQTITKTDSGLDSLLSTLNVHL